MECVAERPQCPADPAKEDTLPYESAVLGDPLLIVRMIAVC
jgi:hypothetical protein